MKINENSKKGVFLTESSQANVPFQVDCHVTITRVIHSNNKRQKGNDEKVEKEQGKEKRLINREEKGKLNKNVTSTLHHCD